jgi:drug/metabolite transporter (DMT)-like permease
MPGSIPTARRASSFRCATPPYRTVRPVFERAAPAFFVVLWSTGFVLAKFGTDDAGPLTFLTVRLGVVSLILVVAAIIMRAPRPTKRETGWLAVSGFLMHALYLGGVFVAVDLGMPTGVSALIAGLHPVLTAVASGPVLGERLRPLQWAGVALGFGGVLAVVADRLGAGVAGMSATAIATSAVSVVAMSSGTIVQRRHGVSAPLLTGSVVQYVAATAALGFGAVTVEGFDIEFTRRTLLSLAWAVVVLSLAAVGILMWLLKRSAAAKVSSLFFLTPALSALEGAVLFGERLGTLAVVGLVGGVCGVGLVTRPPVR